MGMVAVGVPNNSTGGHSAGRRQPRRPDNKPDDNETAKANGARQTNVVNIDSVAGRQAAATWRSHRKRHLRGDISASAANNKSVANKRT